MYVLRYGVESWAVTSEHLPAPRVQKKQFRNKPSMLSVNVGHPQLTPSGHLMVCLASGAFVENVAA